MFFFLNIYLQLHLILMWCDDSLSDDFLSKLLQDPFLLLDLLVHQRLREHRLIHLVMAVTPVTHLNVKRKELRRESAPWLTQLREVLFNIFGISPQMQ